MIYTLDTPFLDFISALKINNGCKEAVDWCNGLCKDNEKITFGEGIKALDNESWATWVLQTFDGQLSDDVQKEFISKIKDPMVAFTLYTSVKNINAENETILNSKFNTKLPTAEKELTDGVVQRKKQ